MENDDKIIELMHCNDKMMQQILTPAIDINLDIYEVALDKFLNEAFLKEIPILKTIYSGYNLANSIQNALFMKKLYLFLKELPNTTEDEKNKFLKKYKKDEPKFVEKLFEIIDKLDDSDKCKFESKIFEKYFYSFINYEEFKLYSYALQKVNVKFIKEAYIILNENNVNEDGHILLSTEIGGSFLSVGMAEVVTYPGTCGYCLNEVSYNFLKCLFE